MLARSLPLRGIAFGMIAYGVIGLIIIVVAMLVTVGTFARIETLSESVGAPLRSTARTVGEASTAFGRFAISLGEAQQSSEDAAALAHESAATMSGLADAMSVTIFGAQPLAQAAEGFREVSGQLDGLGEDLESVADALGHNISDVQNAGTNLRDVRDQMDSLLDEFGETSDGPAEGQSTTGGVRVASMALYALLIWLAIPAVASLLFGFTLLRYARAISGPATGDARY